MWARVFGCRLIWAQVHAKSKVHNREGVRAADQLLQLGAEEEQQLRYLAAVGTYKQGALVATRKRLKEILAKFPHCSQAQTLLDAVDDRLTNETLVAGGALAAVGGIAAVVIGGIVAASSKR